jgi:hypothetical protein
MTSDARETEGLLCKLTRGFIAQVIYAQSRPLTWSYMFTLPKRKLITGSGLPERVRKYGSLGAGHEPLFILA